MTVFTPDWKLTVGGVDYTDIAISDVQHQSGRSNIYTQPLPSYMQLTLVALNNQTLPFDINDSFDLQVKDSTGSYVSLFGGDITDVTVEVGATGSAATVVQYTLIVMGSSNFSAHAMASWMAASGTRHALVGGWCQLYNGTSGGRYRGNPDTGSQPQNVEQREEEHHAHDGDPAAVALPPRWRVILPPGEGLPLFRAH